jgi:arylsulfatase A-like enzyme
MVNNVLLVTVDSLRADYVDFLHDVPAQTPCMRRLSTEGLDFTRAFATGPGTGPSFPAMLTGTLPLSYGGLGPLSHGRPRVSEYLSEAGLSTGGFQCNPFLSKHFNYDRGFDEFKDYQNPLMGLATKIFPRGIELSDPKLRFIDEHLHVTSIIKTAYQMIEGSPRPYVSADVITDDAIDWLDRIDQPFFGWVHYMDVHHPCFPPEEYRDQFGVEEVSQSDVGDWYSKLIRSPDTLSQREIKRLRQLYAAAIVYVDAQIDRLIDCLEKQRVLEDTLIVFTSDHGELFGEHGEYGKPARMYDELLHVPLFVLNGDEQLSAVTDNLVSLLDLPPLMHDQLNITVPDSYEGIRLRTDSPRENVMAEHQVEEDVIVAARSNDFLYEVDEITSEHRLYDVQDGNFRQVTSEQGTEADDLRTAVLDRLARLNRSTGQFDEQLDEDIESRLEDLGYLN